MEKQRDEAILHSALIQVVEDVEDVKKTSPEDHDIDYSENARSKCTVSWDGIVNAMSNIVNARWVKRMSFHVYATSLLGKNFFLNF